MEKLNREGGPEKVFRTAEEKWKEGITDRVKTWKELIESAGIDDSLKKKFSEIIEKSAQRRFDNYYSLDDWAYYTVSQLSNLVPDKQEVGNEISSLFENIRDDIWAFWKEVRKE